MMRDAGEMLGDATTCYDMQLFLLALSYHNCVSPLTSPTGKAPYYAGGSSSQLSRLGRGEAEAVEPDVDWSFN